MPGSKKPAGGPNASATSDEQVIRERVRELTSQMLKGAKLDPEAAKEVMHAVTGSAAFEPRKQDAQARQAFADAIRGLDDAMLKSAQASHLALEQLASKGKDFSDNDLKQALSNLRTLQENFVATANRVADAASGNLRRELAELAIHAERVGADAGARVASVLGEFANRLGNVSRDGATSGLEAVRDYGVRMAFVTSGIIAGVADALRQQAETKKPR
ncbi:MAG: hypothetical protein OEZ08_03640 [Betaproteobacteria bacterium]|nr:hypothetical protein [Betaproteobacteria bacterium]